jgi:holo-[acyl-carrier protein] synthase
MIVGTGIDIADVGRIKESIDRYGAHFTNRVYTPAEVEYCHRFKNAAERYAAAFAAKEAAFKALGTGWRQGIRWLDVEVTHLPSGKPELALCGRARELAEAMRVTRVQVSLSHTGVYAVAQVIFESDGSAR